MSETMQPVEEFKLPPTTKESDPALDQRLDAIAQKDKELQGKVLADNDTFKAPTSQEVGENLDRYAAGPEQAKQVHPPAKPDAA